jgi:hypothetical protein
MATFSTIVVGYGFFIFNELASLAREGARWAVVHGANYVSDYNSSHTPTISATTSTDVYNRAILPHVAGIDTSQLTCTTNTAPGSLSPGATVTVTISYTWTPQLYLPQMTLTGSSTMTMLY